MAAQGEIDVFGKLVSQTTNGVLAGANQIHDPNINKMQSTINAEVQAALAQAGNTEEIQQIVDSARNDILGLIAKNCGESIPGAIWDGVYNDIDEDGEFIGEYAHKVVPSDFGVGSVVKAGDMQSGQEDMFYVAKTAATPSMYYDGQEYIVDGVTEWLTVEKDKLYVCTGRVAISYTPEGEDAITGYLYLYAEAKISLKDIKDAITNIDFSALAKQGTNANATLTAILEALTGGDDPSPDIPEGVAERLAMILEFFGITAATQYTALTDAEVIACCRDEQYNVMGDAWPIPAWLPDGLTEQDIQTAATALGITYHAPTETPSES